MEKKHIPFLAKYGSEEHMNKIIETSSVHKEIVAKNINVQDHHLDRLADSKEPYQNFAVINSNAVKKHHLEKIIKNSDYDSVKNKAAARIQQLDAYHEKNI